MDYDYFVILRFVTTMMKMFSRPGVDSEYPPFGTKMTECDENECYDGKALINTKWR